MNLKGVYDYVITLPKDIDEQKQIASTLKNIDDALLLNKKINDNLAAMAKQLYDYWFVQFDFPDSNGRPYKSSGGKMVWNEKLKREIPSEWQESSIGEQGVYNTDFTANGSFARLAENVKYNEGERYAMLVRIVDFNDDFSDPEKFVYINKHGYDYLKTSHLHRGEIIICNVGNAGATYRCPNIGLNMALGPNGVMLNDERLNNYLYLYFCSAIGQHSIKTITSGSIQLKFNKTSLRN